MITSYKLHLLYHFTTVMSSAEIKQVVKLIIASHKQILFFISIRFKAYNYLYDEYRAGGRGLKDNMVSGISLAILGGLISVVPKFLVCSHCMSMQMKCYWTARMELYIGIFIIVLALLNIFLKPREIKLGVNLSLFLFGLLSMVATLLSGFCSANCSTECTCSSISVLIMAVLGGLTAVFSLMSFVSLYKDCKY